MNKMKHIATYALMGSWTGNRIGTGYVHTFDEVRLHIGKPYFRFRNRDIEAEYRKSRKGEG